MQFCSNDTSVLSRIFRLQCHLMQYSVFDTPAHTTEQPIPTDLFTTLGLQNQWHDVFKLRKFCRSPDFQAPICWKGRSGWGPIKSLLWVSRPLTLWAGCDLSLIWDEGRSPTNIFPRNKINSTSSQDVAQTILLSFYGSTPSVHGWDWENLGFFFLVWRDSGVSFKGQISRLPEQQCRL